MTYAMRATVERKIAEVVDQGLRQARYLGYAKILLQAQWTGAAVKLKRLFKLFQGDTRRMRRVLAAMA